jgi:hypothetical protein
VRLANLIIPSKGEFDAQVHEILQSAEYTHLKNPLKDFLSKAKEGIKEALFKWLKRSFSNIDNAAVVSDRLSTIFMIVGILVIAAIIIIIIVKVNKTFEKKRRVKEILGEKIDNRTTPSSLRQRASGFREAGDLRQAIRYDFIALLLLMHEKSLVYLDETKTNEEIFKYLRKNDFNRADVFKNISDIFNSTWYGHKAADKENYEEWSSNMGLLWNEVIKHEG